MELQKSLLHEVHDEAVCYTHEAVIDARSVTLHKVIIMKSNYI
jgi:hypothetical protein